MTHYTIQFPSGRQVGRFSSMTAALLHAILWVDGLDWTIEAIA